MNVNGFKIKQALAALQTRREQLEVEISHGPLFRREDDKTKRPVEDLMSEYGQVERLIAQLQGAQTIHNAATKVTVSGKEISLAEAVKLAGSLERVAAKWKQLTKEVRLVLHETEYNSESKPIKIPLMRSLSPKDVLSRATTASIAAAAVRAAIAEGNAKSLPFESLGSGLDPALFE